MLKKQPYKLVKRPQDLGKKNKEVNEMGKLSKEEKNSLYIILRYGLKLSRKETKNAISYADTGKKLAI